MALPLIAARGQSHNIHATNRSKTTQVASTINRNFFISTTDCEFYVCSSFSQIPQQRLKEARYPGANVRSSLSCYLANRDYVGLIQSDMSQTICR